MDGEMININGLEYYSFKSDSILKGCFILEDDSMQERKFKNGCNKLCFTGKSDKEIKKVLELFGGEWKETTKPEKPKTETLKCLDCGHIITIPKKEYEKLRDCAEFISDELCKYDSDNTVIAGIITMMDETQKCCVKPNYVRM